MKLMKSFGFFSLSVAEESSNFCKFEVFEMGMYFKASSCQKENSKLKVYYIFYSRLNL